MKGICSGRGIEEQKALDESNAWPYFLGIPSHPSPTRRYLKAERAAVTFPMSMDMLRWVAGRYPSWGQHCPPGAGRFYSNWGLLLAGKCLGMLGSDTHEEHIRSEVRAAVGAGGLHMSHETERGAEEEDYYNDEEHCLVEPDGGPPLSRRKLSMKRSVITGPAEDDYDQPCVRSPDGAYVITGRHGGSGMAASARDLILILKDLASGDPRLLRPESVDHMATAQSALLGTSHGLGFDTAESPSTGLGQLSKSGWYSSLSLCILTNKKGWQDEEDNELGPTMQSLGNQILSAIQGLASPTADSPPWGKYDLSEGLKGEDHGHL
jgi:CubicO group peptidase (beta-lactamase class C family)